MIIDNAMNAKKQGSNFFGNVGKATIALILLAAGMGLTNPARDQYLTYASGQLATELENTVCRDSRVPKSLSGVTDTLIGSCKNLISSQQDTMERLLDNTTHRQNFAIASIYTTELGGKSYQTVGAFSNFVTLPPTAKEDTQK